ncbi:hypothetical protein H4S02_004197 [Coemansia sp. RSA 2611]|nr:hypothetical protein IWW54_003222 [Coemansia sp. RSA 2705]KAJ2324890.1 hypothetical protein IWW51_003057 [Coemansia sp. RSA 2702]KAJ2362254.1 hypothetical protein H4S01_004872 [Coemansia sp. RSA 2610]KAJ2385718.1 hypothetical protein H4S02_004197 [Coemansia sp. RSA 2611]
MAHDGTHIIAAPIKSKPAALGAGGGLPQLDISRCLPPTAPLTPPEQPEPAAQAEATVVVDRSRVIGAGQYSTVCLGTLVAGAGRRACAIKIPHAGSLDARELGLIEAAALWQAGSAAQTVGCYGLVDLAALSARGVGAVRVWPAAAAQAIAGDGEWALVLELCEGGACWARMQAQRPGMDADLFFVWARQLATALAALEAAGMAHMDIKPHNLLLTADGHVRLADFTAARFSAQALEAMRLASPGFDPRAYPPYADFSGTVPYSAPEALTPASSSLHKADVFALGVTLYVLFVSGREPFATVKSAVEQMLLVSKGAFWEWEERHSIATLQSAADPHCTHTLPPPTPVDSHGTLTLPPPSPVEPPHPLSRSLSLGPKPLARRRTLKSRKAAPREFRRFLSGDLLPVSVEALLRDMVNPDPDLRPDAAEILRVLDSIEAQVFEP